MLSGCSVENCFASHARYIYVGIIRFRFGAQVDIRRERIWIHKDELLDVLEIKKEGRIRFYSYTYKIKDKQGGWNPAVRWDNLEQSPHVDIYDENNALVGQKPWQEKPLKEVLKLIDIFRRNLITMDVSKL